MLNYRSLLVVLFFTVSLLTPSCVHQAIRDTTLDSSRRPPFSNFVGSEKSKRWDLLWKKAKLNNETSCDAWKQLSKDAEFPLMQFATIANDEICTLTQQNKNLQNIDTDPFLKWRADVIEMNNLSKSDLNLQKELFEIQLRLASNAKERELKLIQLIELSKNNEDPIRTRELNEKLWKNSPRFRKNPPSSDWILVAKDFREHMEYSQSIRYLKKTLKLNIEDERKWEIYKQLRLTFKVAQLKSEMLATDKIWNQWTTSRFLEKNNRIWSEKLLETRLLVSRALWTEEKRLEAEKVLKKSLQQLRHKIALGEVYFILGKMQEQDKNFQSAFEFYEKAFSEKNELGLRDKILWAQAWLQYKRGQYPLAIQLWTQLIENSSDTNLKYRSQYWMAKSLNRVSPGAGKAQFEKIASEDLVGYYGVLATKELGRSYSLLRKINSSVSNEILIKSGANADLLLSIEWSLFLQEKGISTILLNQLEQQISQLSDSNVQIEFAKLVAASGRYLPLFASLVKTPVETRQKILEQDPSLLFPTINTEFVESNMTQLHFSSSLVYSIIRQESAFDPLTKSPADALGLMQLLPSIAKTRSRSLNLEWKEASQLFEPQFNIQIGSAELESLLQRWNQQYIPAIASYNANEVSVKGWIKNRFEKDPLEFIEEIPYEETRNYVKLVLRNYVFYERLKRTAEFQFPDELLKLQK